MKKRLSALFATAALLTGLTLTSGAGSATASAQAPCDSVAFSNVSDGVGYFAGTYNLKVAPAMECENVASGPQGAKFYFWCHVYNYYGNLWVYGRLAGTTTQGWTSMDNLRWEGGTLLECPAGTTPPAAPGATP